MNILINSKIVAMQEHINALLERFEKLQLQTYPKKEVKDIIVYMSSIAEQFNVKLLEYQRSDKDIDVDTFNLLNELFYHFYYYVGRVVNCDIRNHPREMMIPVKDTLNKLNSRHKFITVPSWEINYSIGPIMHDELKETLYSTGFEIDKELKIVQLVFPTLHQDNILLGGIMSHELGHYLDLHYSLNITENIIPQIINSMNIEKYALEHYVNNGIQDQKLKESIVKGLLPECVLRSWISEIVADIIGILIYGISSYFSTEQISRYYNQIYKQNYETLTDKFSESHPRDALRNLVRKITIQKMYTKEQLDDQIRTIIENNQEEWNKAAIYRPEVKFHEDDNSGFMRIDGEYYSSLENDIKRNLDFIIEKTIKILKEESEDLIYKPQYMNEYVCPMVQKIKKLIPPNEFNGQPIDSISIINAGWITYLLHKDAIKSQIIIKDELNEDREIRKIIDNLIKKATLSSNIHRGWIDATSK